MKWERLATYEAREVLGMIEHVETIIVGAGQAGLAMSRCLSEAGREHLKRADDADDQIKEDNGRHQRQRDMAQL